ncbi:TcpD family membrane protein (plasmid) [Clostridium baratii]
MNKLIELKERIKNKIITNKRKVETFLLTFFLVSAPTICAYAVVDGEAIKNKLLTNFIGPILFVMVAFALMKEVSKRNTAGIIISALVGAFVYIFVYYPSALATLAKTIKDILGL